MVVVATCYVEEDMLQDSIAVQMMNLNSRAIALLNDERIDHDSTSAAKIAAEEGFRSALALVRATAMATAREGAIVDLPSHQLSSSSPFTPFSAPPGARMDSHNNAIDASHETGVPPLNLDEGLDSLDTSANYVIDLQPKQGSVWNDSSLLASPSSDCIQAVLWFNLAQVKYYARGQKECNESISFCYRQALEAVVKASSWTTAESTGGATSTDSVALPTATTLWLIRTVAIPSLYHLGRLAYQNQATWVVAASYMEIALQHTMNPAIWTVTAPTVGDSGNATISGATTARQLPPMIRWVGVILNALGVIHYHLSCSLLTAPSSLYAIDAMSHSNSSLLYLTEALPILTEAWGSQSRILACVLNNLGRLYLQRNDAAAAIPHLQAAVLIRQVTLDALSLDTAASLFNLGVALFRAGDVPNALTRFDECLVHPSMAATGSYNDDVVTLQTELAAIFEQVGDYGKAERLHRQCINMVESAFGGRHFKVAALLHQLGKLHFDFQQYEAAQTAFQGTLRILRTIHQSSHPNVILTLCVVGEVYRKQDQPEEALKYFKEAMELKRLHYSNGNDCLHSIPIAAALQTMGSLHDELGEPHWALQCLQESVRMRESIQGSDHMDLVEAIADIGALLCRNDMVHNGLEAYTEACRISVLHLGRDHSEVGSLLSCIGDCYLQQGSTESAIACWNETLRIQRYNCNNAKVLDKVLDSNEISTTLMRLGDAHRMNSNFPVSIDFYTRALKEENGKDTVDMSLVTKILRELGSLHMRLGQVDDLMATFAQSARRLLLESQDPNSSLLADLIVTPPGHGLENNNEQSAAASA